MSNIFLNKDFVPYEQALEMVELGFDEDCMASINMEDGKGLIQLPLYPQAFRFIRAKYNIDNLISSKYDRCKTYYFRIETPPTKGYSFFKDDFQSYEEAELECLKQSIQMIKQNYFL